MPHSLVLNLQPVSAIPAGFTSNKHLHALFLNLVGSVDPHLSTLLHDNQANKPFTLSPLQTSPAASAKPKPKLRHSQNAQQKVSLKPLRWNYRQSLGAGTPCWWRISLLDDEIFAQLSRLWLNLNPEQPWHLGPANLHITSVLGSPQSAQPWAGYCDYEELFQQASERDRTFTLQFFTPTAFRQGKADSAFPVAQRVFGSLLRRWNEFSDRPFPSDIVDCIQDKQFDIATKVASDPRQQYQHTGAKVSHCNNFVGCVGTVTYQVYGKIDPLVLKQINTLADYALYAGVGRKTPMGMGITRRIHT